MKKSQENGITKGPWSTEEDQKLIDYIKKNGQGNWQKIAKKAGLNRCGKSCRLRWTNYLKPGIKRGGFSDEEEAIIIALHKEMGNKWSRIAGHLPRRTDNEIKNHWNTHLRKKLLKMGIDPTTHMPIPPPPPPHHDLNNLLNLSHQVDQLFTASNLYNYLNVPPLDGGLLGLQEINADDLIKLQILQNTLQLMNPSPLPYSVQGNANLGDHLVQLDRLYNGATNDIPTVDPFQTHSSSTMSDWSTVSASLLNQMQQPLTSKSLPCFEIESVTTPWSVMNDRNSIFNSEYSFEPLPSLVTVTPESSTVTKLENTEQSYINTDQPDHDQLQTNQFEPWETLNVDDEANSSLWKDIFG